MGVSEIAQGPPQQQNLSIAATEMRDLGLSREELMWCRKFWKYVPKVKCLWEGGNHHEMFYEGALRSEPLPQWT